MKKKRVRGLRRHARKHWQWAAVPQALDLAGLAQHHSDYEQLGLNPWTVYGKPPLAIRKLWASRLLNDVQQWHSQLASLYSEFYLAIWLYEPRFGLSQLVVKTKNQDIERYKAMFGEASAVALPIEYQLLPGAEKLQWTAYPEIDFYDTEEFTEMGRWAARKPHWKVNTIQGPYIAVQSGWVWVGQFATELP